MIDLVRLSYELRQAGLSGDCAVVAAIHAVSGVSTFHTRTSDDVIVRVDWGSQPSQANQSDADAVIQGHDGSKAATAAADNLANRTIAVANLSDPSAPYKLQRAALLLLLDENNLLRQRNRAQDAAIAAATNLADLKSRWATLASNQPMPDRTAAQLRTAVQNKLTAGDADS